MQLQENKESKKLEVSLQASQIHRLSNQNKILYTEGQSFLFSQNSNLILSINVFAQILKTPLARRVFANSTSFIFIGNQSEINVISFPKVEFMVNGVGKFESILRQNKLLIDWEDVESSKLRALVEKEYSNQNQIYEGKVQMQEKQTGIWGNTKHFFVSTGQSIGNGFNKAFNYYNEKIGEKNQERWTHVKEKAASWNQKSHTFWKPVAEKTNAVIQKTQTSQNWGLKLIRDISKGTQKILNNTTNRFRGGRKPRDQNNAQDEVQSEVPQGLDAATNNQLDIKNDEVRSN